ncbi:MAG: hypothetical protein QUS14_01295 [Pyrinomonadaceae bacterium]|nr:hypothetical protein [Pyrinomonadaceae bacterium]
MSTRYDRMPELSQLLDTALDSTEEYIHEGEMCFYPRRYADDACSRIDMMLRTAEPDEAEMALIIDKLLVPDRLGRGSSLELLIGLRERSGRILRALAENADKQVRLFALEACKASLPGHYYRPLYGAIDIERRLLDDRDTEVRSAAVEASIETLLRNSDYVRKQIEIGSGVPLVALFNAVLGKANDPLPQIRERVNEALSGLLHR